MYIYNHIIALASCDEEIVASIRDAYGNFIKPKQVVIEVITIAKKITLEKKLTV